MRTPRWQTLTATLLAILLCTGVVGTPARAGDRTDDMFNLLRQVYETVKQNNLNGASLDKFVTGAIDGGLATLGDPYTNFMSAEEQRKSFDQLNGKTSGIGVHLVKEGSYITVIGVIKNGPADRAGIAPGDRLLEVNGSILVNVPMDSARKAITGAKGSTARLKIERPSESRTFTVTIERDDIVESAVKSRMLDDQTGLIELSQFGSGAAQDFFAAVNQLKAQGAKGLVLDLRQNGGGFVNEALTISNGFVPAGKPILWLLDNSGVPQPIVSDGTKLVQLPTAVLVGRWTASAAEILAGAIADSGTGTIIGEKTYGKGVMQGYYPLMGENVVKTTIAEYLTPKQRHVNGIGITPDVAMADDYADPARVAPMPYTRMIGPFMDGLDVQRLQTRLVDLGYDPDTDGIYSRKTRAAVLQFQADNGLPQEPLVDEPFIHALNLKFIDFLRNGRSSKDAQLAKAVTVLKAKATGQY